MNNTINKSKTNIKKIVYNEAYGCWGRIKELSRTFVVFEPKKITYCKEPLEKHYSKKSK